MQAYTLEQVAFTFGKFWNLKTTTGLVHAPQDIDLDCKVELFSGEFFDCWKLRIVDCWFDDVTHQRVATAELVPYSMDKDVRNLEFRLSLCEIEVFDLDA